MKKWTRSNIKDVLRARIFKYQTVESTSSDGRMTGLFDVVRTANWVNVLAINTNNEIVLVKQYRHGTDEITLELPAGAIEKDEEPLIAAKRELAEETGHTGGQWKSLGAVKVNPAFMTNTCYFYLAEGVEKTQEQNLDPLEEVDVVYHTLDKVKELVNNNIIDHSLSQLGVARYLTSL